MPTDPPSVARNIKPQQMAILMPSDVSSRVGFFDRFPGLTAQMASRAPFFAFCLLLVLVWLIQGGITMIADRSFAAFLDGQYQLEINTTTTIITFLIIALLQNGQTRSDHALKHKLNAIADGIADLTEHLSRRATPTTISPRTSESSASRWDSNGSKVQAETGRHTRIPINQRPPTTVIQTSN